MKHVLIIGSGAREHAIGWKLKQQGNVELFFAPGNAGTKELGKHVSIAVEDIENLALWAKNHHIDLTIVGPEVPLVLGVVDQFELLGLRIFGPTKQAAQLEGSKAWATKFMQRNGIPHPPSTIVHSLHEARRYLASIDATTIVIKADGLAAGKGVIVPNSQQEAEDALVRMMKKKEFGSAGEIVVFQERLQGKEISLLACSDGKTVIPMIPVSDFKRIGQNDTGLNTGGMGAIGPIEFSNDLESYAVQSILQPTITGMANEGIPFKGVLYAGLMHTKEGLKVLEYNVRFGDPETQILMALLDSDLLTILTQCVTGKLTPQAVSFSDNRKAVCIVLAAGGYPEKPLVGDPIYGLDHVFPKDVVVFHASTKRTRGQYLTNGGRVISVVATAQKSETARKYALSVIGEKGIYFKGMQFRRDIGKKVVQ